ncbi:MAG: VIT1/CCC1 transporter family protein, partial [Alphaproteobacteria bacterium]|nr:VIT1/CCC1 transporter family protein [Alphaproteobacteria bacterium]
MFRKNGSFGSIVLGMHDALVSTLGLISALVFASAENYVIILTSIIASVAAGLSMMASKYLAEKANGVLTGAIGQGVLTGIAYVVTS